MSDEQWVASYELWDLTEGNKRHILSSERWGEVGTLRAASEENTRVIISRISQNFTRSLWRDCRDLREWKPRTLHADVPTLFATHYSLLTAHYSLLIMFFCRKMNLRLIPHICQKTRKGDFGVRKKNVKDFNLLIIKWIQTNDITPENTRKKDLSVSGVSLKSFWKNT